MKTLALIALSLIATTANAQDDRSSSAKRGADQEVREVERGMYLKGGAGTNQYIGGASGLVRPVMALNLAAGQDFIDQEKFSMAWEVTFGQALHNGPKLNTGDMDLAWSRSSTAVQGDIHTFSGVATVEASTYLGPRLGLGLRAGGGLMVVPVLMNFESYANDLEAYYGFVSPVHAGPLPIAVAGPTLEYYTKLSHFSVGTDVDVLIPIGFDLGLSINGYMKYTF